MQAPEADVLNLAAVPEEHEGEEGGEEEELEETIEAAQQQKRLLAERNASLQNKVHQVRPPWSLCFASGAYPSVNAFTKLAMTLVALTRPSYINWMTYLVLEAHHGSQQTVDEEPT